ncbi:MAG TPA: hypothetical protein VF989_16655 [Polyangiaceae bacterium]
MKALAFRVARLGAALSASAFSAAVADAQAPAAEPRAVAPQPAPAAAAGSSGRAACIGVPGGLVGGRGLAVGTIKMNAPPPPAPSAQKLKALQLLEEEAAEYERSARAFKKTLTTIVRHHYEARRRRVLSALDEEIGAERSGLDDARKDAIRRLEEFVARYSGANADPDATPDAMFRLAALYEERARADFDADLSVGLEPAVVLYRRIIADYPDYEEVAAIHYYLGHALTDAARIEEGQQAFRALVCKNRYRVAPDPKDASKIVLQPQPQDHDDKFWNEWYNRNPIPLDQREEMSKGRRDVGAAEEELTFVDPYADCEPQPQNTDPGQEPRYLAEVWWQLGNFHFDQIDPRGGPYNLARAVSAYRRSMEYKRPPLYGVAMYKLAWTYFKQQRYKAATEEFVKLLHYADEQEKETGDPGADFRSEAYTYIAGSLTYVDFDGPPPDDPYVPRNDVLDTETNPLVAEDKMAIAIERVQDPKLIPQGEKWTGGIYKSLAQEFIEITQNRNAIRMLELTLSKFPLDRDAPQMQNKVAELYDQLSRLAPDGSEARAEYAEKALSARTKLAEYVGTTSWTDANRDDPEALEQAELLVRGGLKRAAADHTNYARSFYNKALEISDEAEQRRLVNKSIEEYQLAESGWAAYLQQDPAAVDGYETRFWLADARYWGVVLKVAVGRSPSEAEVDCARASAIAVRDSNEDDRYLQPSAYYVVTVVEKALEDAYRTHEQTNGARGIERREEVRFVGTGDSRKFVTDPLPPRVKDAISARDEYNARIPLESDPERNGLLYQFQSGDLYFVYGHFAEARKYFTPLYEKYCGANEWGYKAWDKLVSMSNFENNATESLRLAQAKSCAYDEDTKAAEEALRKPVIQGAAYLEARNLYRQAEALPEGPERAKKWREAAAAYKVALDAAPDRDEAPEAAMNGAFAYKQVGEYDKAIEMYELFISRYGNDKTLRALKDGDPKAQPPAAPQPEKYQERVKFLKGAYDALANAYVLFFDYPKAAETFYTIGTNQHFSQADRRESAQQALSLYASLDDASGMRKARERFAELGASPNEMAEADFVIASAQLKKWDEYSPDRGANGAARRNAQAAMETYYLRSKDRDEAAQWVVHAAYYGAKTRRAARANDTNKWWTRTAEAFQRWRALAPRKEGQSSALGSQEANMAAEAEFTMLDEQIARDFDYESGHHRYRGTTVEVVQEYKRDAVDAKKWYDKLQRIVDTYVSPEWTTVSIARQGSLYDSLRTGLYNARPPALKMFSAAQETALKRAEQSDNLELQEKADAIRVSVQQAWRKKRDQELDSADQIMVDRYANAVVLARRYTVSHPEVTRAVRRLAFFTDVIGEAKLKQFTATVKDLNYSAGMFAKTRPGLVTAPKHDGMPAPLPAAP